MPSILQSGITRSVFIDHRLSKYATGNVIRELLNAYASTGLLRPGTSERLLIEPIGERNELI